MYTVFVYTTTPPVSQSHPPLLLWPFSGPPLLPLPCCHKCINVLLHPPPLTQTLGVCQQRHDACPEPAAPKLHKQTRPTRPRRPRCRRTSARSNGIRRRHSSAGRGPRPLQMPSAAQLFRSTTTLMRTCRPADLVMLCLVHGLGEFGGIARLDVHGWAGMPDTRCHTGHILYIFCICTNCMRLGSL